MALAGPRRDEQGQRSRVLLAVAGALLNRRALGAPPRPEIQVRAPGGPRRLVVRRLHGPELDTLLEGPAPLSLLDVSEPVDLDGVKPGPRHLRTFERPLALLDRRSLRLGDRVRAARAGQILH